MTAPNTDQQQGTAVATQAGEEQQSRTKLAVGMLPDAIKHQLILARQRNLVSAEIASTNWGKGLDDNTRMQVSTWAQTAGIDPATELDVLGGKFYKNANYFIRKLSELAEAGLIEHAYADHVEVDPRLETLAKRTDDLELAAQARREIDRRMMMRIQYCIPDAAVSSVVFHVKLPHIVVEFTAAKWCGGGTRKSDPVGDSFPVETSETRAIRRTMRLIASQNPAFRPLVEPNDDDTIDSEIGGTLRDGLMRAKASVSVADIRPRPLMATSYGDEPRVAQPQLAAAAAQPDAYTGAQPGKVEEPVTTVPAPAAHTGKAIAVAEPAPAAPASTGVDDLFQDDTALMTPAELVEHEARKRNGRG
jgi:hypothetical protein